MAPSPDSRRLPAAARAHLPLRLPFPALTHGRLGPFGRTEPGTKHGKDDGVAGKENAEGIRIRRSGVLAVVGTKGKKGSALILSSTSSSSLTQSPPNPPATYHLSPRLRRHPGRGRDQRTKLSLLHWSPTLRDPSQAADPSEMAQENFWNIISCGST